jgi:hypothetical protein
LEEVELVHRMMMMRILVLAHHWEEAPVPTPEFRLLVQA